MPTDRSGHVALITGVTGQDGAYLADLLIRKGYIVHGVHRRSSLPNTARLDELGLTSPESRPSLILHRADLGDAASLTRLMAAVRPDEVYNLAAQSDVQASFQMPEYTADTNALGVVRLLEAIRVVGLETKTRFYQASTSELFGQAVEIPQSEETTFRPRSPYAVAKLHAYWAVRNYRDAYDIHASNGILFNHESPLRGKDFVTRKITLAVAAIHAGAQERIQLGNIDDQRDWGHARIYVRGMWLMLQQEHPGDYVLATGKATTVREFVTEAFRHVAIEVNWSGAGIDEKGVCARTGRVLVEIDRRLFRPNGVELLVGDPSKAARELGWRSETDWRALCAEMVAADLKKIAARGLSQGSSAPTSLPFDSKKLIA